HAGLAPLRRQDAVAVQEPAAAQLLYLAHGVQHAAGDVLERGLHRGRRLAAGREPVALGGALDQDGLGGGGAAVGGEDGADGSGRGDHALRLARSRSSVGWSLTRPSSSSASRRSTSAATRRYSGRWNSACANGSKNSIAWPASSDSGRAVSSVSSAGTSSRSSTTRRASRSSSARSSAASVSPGMRRL